MPPIAPERESAATSTWQTVPGDTKMPIYIYTIGFLGDGGCDQGLLARIANDASLSNAYDTTTPAGKYYPATDEVALHNAFETIAATILRLAK